MLKAGEAAVLLNLIEVLCDKEKYIQQRAIIIFIYDKKIN